MTHAPAAGAVVFADFDGTITTRETFAAVLKGFAPDLARDLVPRMLALELPLRVGVARILESIPSAAFDDVIRSADGVPLRDGFDALLADLTRREVPFVVLSGGLRAMIERVLGPRRALVRAVHALDLDTTGPYFKVIAPDASDDEMVAKAAVMARYAPRFAVAVGDSVTDIGMAEAADLVFARDRLAEVLTVRGRPFVRYETFHDVRHHLEALWDQATPARA